MQKPRTFLPKCFVPLALTDGFLSPRKMTRSTEVHGGIQAWPLSRHGHLQNPVGRRRAPRKSQGFSSHSDGGGQCLSLGEQVPRCPPRSPDGLAMVSSAAPPSFLSFPALPRTDRKLPRPDACADISVCALPHCPQPQLAPAAPLTPARAEVHHLHCSFRVFSLLSPP